MKSILFVGLALTFFSNVCWCDAKKGEVLFVQKTCSVCHGAGGKGGQVGPDLSQVKLRKNRQELITWLHDPAAVKPEAKMPKLKLTDQEINELVDYLQSLQ